MYRLGNWFLEVWGDEVVGRGDCYENPRFSHIAIIPIKVGIGNQNRIDLLKHLL